MGQVNTATMTKSKSIKSPYMETPYISPENRMNPDDMDNVSEKPIIEMTEDKNLLYMALRNMAFGDSSISFAVSPVDFMASIIYNAKEKTIEMRGRMRYESTGTKTVFSDKVAEPYTKTNYDKKKKMIQSFTENLTKDMPIFQPLEDLFELEFKIGEDIDSIVYKMNASNRFNIGTMPKP